VIVKGLAGRVELEIVEVPVEGDQHGKVVETSTSVEMTGILRHSRTLIQPR